MNPILISSLKALADHMDWQAGERRRCGLRASRFRRTALKDDANSLREFIAAAEAE